MMEQTDTAKEIAIIVEKTLALDLDELKLALVEAQEALEKTPEGHWMRGLLGIAVISTEAFIEYKEKLEAIGAELVYSMNLDDTDVN